MNIKGFSVILAALASAAVFADEMKTFYWTGGSGNWSDVDNWSMSADGTSPATSYPGEPTNVIDGVAYYATNHVAIFTGTAVGTIMLDKDVEIHRFSVLASAQPTEIIFESHENNPCRLRMTTKTTSTHSDDTSINGKRTAIFRNIKIKGVSLDFRGGDGIFDAGAELDIGGSIYAWDKDGCLIRYLDGCNVKATLHANHLNGTHLIEGGRVTGNIDPNSQHFTVRVLGGVCEFSSVSMTSNSVFDIQGGDVKISSTIKLPATSQMIISGGEVYSEKMPTIDDEASFVFTNGVLTVPFSVTDSRILGSGDAVFKNTLSPSASNYNTKPSINVINEDGMVVKCGTVFATNGNFSAFHFVNDATLAAKTLNLSRFTIDAEKNITLFADRLNLGERLFPTVNGASLTLPNGITFGAFGDWSVHNKDFSLNLGGNILVDTTDCFDGISAHTVTVSKVVALPGLKLSVRGGGDCIMSIKQSPTVLEKLAVDNGSSLTFSSDSRGLVIEDFNLGTDSKLNLACGMGGLEIVNGAIDSSAKISIQVNDNLAKPVYPLISFSDEATANTVVSQISFIGEGVDNYNLNRFRNCLYLSNGVEPTHEVTLSSTNIWTGEANASWSDERNWLSGYKPIATTNKGHAEIFIAGTRNTDMVNEIEGLYVKRLHFLDSCGPVRISGGKIFFTLNGYRNVKSSPIYSLSYFPVMIDADLETVNALSTVAAKDSYVSLNGKVVIKGLFRPSGEIRVGGQLECGTGILLETKCADGRSTRMRVLNGGSVTATLQMTNQTTASSCYVIDAGGTLVLKDGKNNKGVRSVCGHLVSLKPSLVNGEMDIQCPYFTTKDQYYNGTGEIKFASVQSHELGSSSVIVGGGLTVKPASWTTVSAEAPGNYIKIAVTNNAILSASANWTYGPAEGVTPTTSAEERALTLAPNSTLTIRTDGFRVAFADPIIGAGDVVVESGSRLALAGELFNEAASQSWTTFAKVKSFTYDEGAFPSTVRLRTVDNGDGTVDVQARIVPGLTISIR